MKGLKQVIFKLFGLVERVTLKPGQASSRGTRSDAEPDILHQYAFKKKFGWMILTGCD